jgi:hypothetical protein
VLGGIVDAMQPTPRHHEVEARFRALIEDSEIPVPDRVEYEPASVLFLWDDSRLAVCVDFDASRDEARASG